MRRDTKAPLEVWVVNSEDTAEWRSRARSLVKNELLSSEADVVEPFRPIVAVGCIMTDDGKWLFSFCFCFVGSRISYGIKKNNCHTSVNSTINQYQMVQREVRISGLSWLERSGGGRRQVVFVAIYAWGTPFLETLINRLSVECVGDSLFSRNMATT